MAACPKRQPWTPGRERPDVHATRAFAASSAAGLLRNTVGASAQEWPRRPIRIIVPFGPGGGADIIGRILAQSLQESSASRS